MVASNEMGAYEMSGALTESIVPFWGHEISAVVCLTGSSGTMSARNRPMRPATMATTWAPRTDPRTDFHGTGAIVAVPLGRL